MYMSGIGSRDTLRATLARKAFSTTFLDARVRCSLNGRKAVAVTQLHEPTLARNTKVLFKVNNVGSEVGGHYGKLCGAKWRWTFLPERSEGPDAKPELV